MSDNDDRNPKVSKIVPNINAAGLPQYYAVVYRRRTSFLRFILGKHTYRIISIINVHPLTREIKGWQVRPSRLFTDYKDAVELAMELWANNHHSLCIRIAALFNPYLRRYLKKAT